MSVIIFFFLQKRNVFLFCFPAAEKKLLSVCVFTARGVINQNSSLNL